MLPAALAGLSLTLSAAVQADKTAGEASLAHWHFQVLLDGKPIGFHDFSVTAAGGDRDVTGHTRFEVRVLHVPVYHYEHWDRESWHAGCLTRIDARTDDDGHAAAVHGAAEGAEFNLDTPDGPKRLTGCIGTYAYWDSSLVSRGHLLNAQTGRYDPVSVETLAPEPFDSGNPVLSAQRLRLRSSRYAIDLWYDREGRWLGLETRTSNGRLLRYVLVP